VVEAQHAVEDWYHCGMQCEQSSGPGAGSFP
jgi:hypothetical protein